MTAFRSSATVPTVTAPHRSKPLTLRKPRYDDVTVRRSVLSNSGGTALSVTGPAAKACEALDLESAGEPLVLVVASNQTALREALGSKALTYSNVIGAVDSLAFAESDQLHIVSAKLPPHVEAWTFDAKRGALPDLGRRRLEAALAKHTAPHFLVFGGDAASEEDDFDDDDGDDGAAALERFARRVDGLFPHGTCAGAAARVNGAVLARLVHARRRPGPRKRAKRLKVFAAHKSDRPLVGVALLPREAGADAAAAAQKLSELCFGGSLRFHWAAGDGTSGPVWKSKFYGAFVLNRRDDLHVIDATPARWRGNAGSSPLDRARTAAPSPRNDFMKNCRVHPTHWLISTQTCA